MNVKRLLISVVDAQRRIRELLSRREHYRELATSISGMSENRIRSTDKRSRVESAALALVDLGADLGKQAETLAEHLREAECLLVQLPNARHSQILSLRYLEARSWEDIMRVMGYSDIHSAYRTHGHALAELQKIADRD